MTQYWTKSTISWKELVREMRFEEQEQLPRKLNQKTEQTVEKSETQAVDDNLPQKNTTCPNFGRHPRNCAEASAAKRQNGLYTIQIDSYNKKPFLVYCEDSIQGGGWTVIQRRKDGSTDFFRDWASYKTGFGNLNGEFFIGLDKLHALTTDTPQELLIVMTDFDDVTKYAKYDAFAIGDEEEQYTLKALGAYSGDAGDSLSYHAGFKFTTKDKHNDPNNNNCATSFKGAWWYNKCHKSNLNGNYLKGAYDQSLFAQGVVWEAWRGFNYSLKTVQILIRPR